MSDAPQAPDPTADHHPAAPAAPAVPDIRFDVELHTADGGFSVPGLAIALVLMAVGGAAIGWVLGFVSQWFYLILLFPIIAGAGLGAVGMAGVRVGKVRNAALAVAIAFIGAMSVWMLMALETQHVMISTIRDYAKNEGMSQAEIDEVMKPFEEMNFVEFQDWFASEIGVEISSSRGGSSSKGLNLGHVGSWIYWGVEILIIAGIAVFMALGATKDPFDVPSDSWKVESELITLDRGGRAVAKAFQSGNLQEIAALVADSHRAKGGKKSAPVSTVVYSAVAERPSEESTVEFRVEEQARNEKNETVKNDQGVCSYPHHALRDIREAIMAARPRLPGKPRGDAPAE